LDQSFVSPRLSDSPWPGRSIEIVKMLSDTKSMKGFHIVLDSRKP